jgi:alkyl hydroperoxide reductase subunit AhpC
MATLVGKKAPAFKAKAVLNGEILEKEVTLDQYKGKWLVLFFYPLDFTFVCPTELVALSDSLPEFQQRNAEVLGVSCDSEYSHLAWTRTPRKQQGVEGLRVPLAADFTKTISRDYGVLFEENGASLRGVFLINPEGTVVSETIHFFPVGRSVGEILRTLDAFQAAGKGVVCPVNWSKGKEAINPKKAEEYFEKVE